MHRATAAANPLQTLLDLINSTLSLLLYSSSPSASSSAAGPPSTPSSHPSTLPSLTSPTPPTRPRTPSSTPSYLNSSPLFSPSLLSPTNILTLDFHHQSSVCEQAIFAVCLLAIADDESSRKAVFEEGSLGPLLRILESESIHLKEKVVMVVEALTVNLENA